MEITRKELWCIGTDVFGIELVVFESDDGNQYHTNLYLYPFKLVIYNNINRIGFEIKIFNFSITFLIGL
jgi:hypothetical protein